MADEVTIGEVFRLVKSVKEEHGEKLDAIDQQVRLTNGRTTTLEAHVSVLNREVRELQSRPTPQHLTPPDSGESFSVSGKVSAKMWALIASAVAGLSIFSPIVAEWLKKTLLQ